MSDTKTLMLRIHDLQLEIDAAQKALAACKAELATCMGDQKMLVYRGLVAKKWPNVRYSVDSTYLVNSLPAEVLDWFREPVITKDKMERAVRAGVMAPAVFKKAVERQEKGWVVSVQKVRGA